MVEQENGKWQDDSKYMQQVKERILKVCQSKFASYLTLFLNDKGISDPSQPFDAVELSLYICRRLQTDNDWLSDKLSMVEKQRAMDEDLWSERLRVETEKVANCDNCALLINRMDMIVHEMPDD